MYREVMTLQKSPQETTQSRKLDMTKAFGKNKSIDRTTWVPQDVVATGGKCSVMKWVREDTLRVLKEKARDPDATDPEPEPTSEVLFLCSYEGCGKTFIDAGALRKHSHIHGERQYVCHYDGCGKKFLDSSKLKRHFLIHTGERDFVCPHEGCAWCGNCCSSCQTSFLLVVFQACPGRSLQFTSKEVVSELKAAMLVMDVESHQLQEFTEALARALTINKFRK